jgi:hypothetical protein
MENNSVTIPAGTVLVPLDQFTYMAEQATRLGVIEELIPEELADEFSTVRIILEGVEALKSHIMWEKKKQAGKAEPDDAILSIIQPPATPNDDAAWAALNEHLAAGVKTVPACPDIEKVKALCAAGWGPADIACEFATDAATVEKWLDQERRNPTDGNSK